MYPSKHNKNTKNYTHHSILLHFNTSPTLFHLSPISQTPKLDSVYPLNFFDLSATVFEVQKKDPTLGGNIHPVSTQDARCEAKDSEDRKRKAGKEARLAPAAAKLHLARG